MSLQKNKDVAYKEPAESASFPPSPKLAALQMGATIVNRKLCTLSILMFLTKTHLEKYQPN